MTISIDGFSRGLDVSRPAYASDPRTLAVLTNAHLSRGSDIEQRKAFVDAYACAGTKGLAVLNDQLYVFGSAEAKPGGVHANLAYQSIPHPDGHALVDVTATPQFADALYVVGRYADGSYLHWYDGELVEQWVDGRARGSFYLVSGSAGAANKVVAVKVNGLDVLGGEVAWATSHEATAAAIAAQITAEGLYTAEAAGQQVQVIALAAGDAPNGQTLEIVVSGDVACSLIAQMGGGGGADGLVPGPAAITYGDKLYSVSGPRLHFSELFDPLTVQPNDNGAGYVDLSTSGEGVDELVGLAPYYSTLAIFGKTGLQIWAVDADDAENQRLQTIPDIGLAAPRAIQTWKDGGVQFLSRRGIKALQSRDSSGRGGLGDVSLPVDSLLIPQLNALSADARSQAIMLVEPEDGRLWCIVGSRVYVYSEFGTERVAGWSIYEPGKTFTHAVVADNRLFLRYGDMVCLYGGESGVQYDAAPVTVRLQFLGGGGSAVFHKEVTGIDIGCEGAWEAFLLPDFANPATAEKIADLTGPTFDLPWHPAASWSAFFSIELRRAAASKGTISSIHIHVAGDDLR